MEFGNELIDDVFKIKEIGDNDDNGWSVMTHISTPTNENYKL